MAQAGSLCISNRQQGYQHKRASTSTQASSNTNSNDLWHAHCKQ